MRMAIDSFCNSPGASIRSQEQEWELVRFSGLFVGEEFA
jgi:hypothetical protein